MPARPAASIGWRGSCVSTSSRLIHNSTRTALPMAPGTIAGAWSERQYTFKNFSFAEIHDHFLEYRKLLLSRSNPNRPRFLLTVSPVPLTATATSGHVRGGVATTYSKSVLRAVAGELANEFGDVDYFPSFEIICNPWAPQTYYSSNLRSVSASGVQTVMKGFLGAHGVSMPAQSPPAHCQDAEQDKARASSARGTDSEQARCEDELLDVFGPASRRTFSFSEIRLLGV